MTRHRVSIARSLAVVGTLFIVAAGCALLNREPVPIFSRTPASGEAPLSIFLDASASVDPDGFIATYEWSFGDGDTADGARATHTYEDAGTYEVVLTVTDDGGKRTSVSKMVTVVSETDPVAQGTGIGKAAPDFALPGLLDDAEHSLSDYRGYVVLLDFWGSWCPPCRTSMPHLESLRETYAGQGLVVLAVAVNDTRGEAVAYLESAGFTEFVAVLDPQDSPTRTLYAVDSIPRTFVIDRQGIIRFVDHPVRLRSYDIEPWL